MNKTIRVYGWHPITKEPLQGEFYADESPLDDDVYHLPQYTTKKPVPILTEHACALYDEASDDWLIVPDYRGETLYSKADGEPFVIEKLGDIPENLTFLARPSKAHDWDGKQWVLNQAKQSELEAQEKAMTKSRVWDAIRNERDRRIQAGGYKVGDKWYHSDTFSRTQQMGLVMLGANMPASLMWKTLDGSFVQMTPTLAQQIFSAAAMSDQMIFKAAEVHKAAMESSSKPATYNYLINWPKAYGE